MKMVRPKVYGVLGSNISYSLSPQIFRILFDKFRLPHGYFFFDIRPDKFVKFIESARLLDIAGFSVTIPFKCAIMQHLDMTHSSAKYCRAVNLVSVQSGRLIGHNTDIVGVEQVLRQARVPSLKKKQILIIGAGGTARAILGYAMSCEPSGISIANRGRKRLKEMLSAFGIENGSNGIQAHQLPGLRNRLEDSTWDVVFNATPVATEKIVPAAAIRSATVVFEAAYGLKSRKLPPGTRVVGGIDMLIFQALRGFEILTGVKIENYRSARSAIKRKLVV
jgi:shikimate dehydrogenase